MRWPPVLRIAALVAVACGLASCVAGARQPAPLSPEAKQEEALQRGLAVEAFYERVERLNAIAYRLARANEPLCRQQGKSRRTLGMTVEFFTPAGSGVWFEPQCAFWGVRENTLVVTSVMPGGPAEAAGVRKGDVIEAANRKIFVMGNPRGDATLALDHLAARGPVQLQISRAGERRFLTVPDPLEVCESRFVVVVGDAVNAYATGRQVLVTYGIMNLFPRDEDLAVVLGHELAHNTLGHIRVDGLGKTVATATPQTEAEADAVGLYYAARAGFDITGAPGVWRRLAAQSPGNIRGSAVHPSSASRFVDLEAVKAEILRKQAAGQPLVPERRAANAP